MRKVERLREAKVTTKVWSTGLLATRVTEPPFPFLYRRYLRWGAAIFKQFDADSDGKLTGKELASALKDLPKTKPKKVPPGLKFQSIEEMMAAMDSDDSGSLDLAEWLANLGQCPGLAAALAENVTVGEGAEEISVAAEEVKALTR